MINQATHVSRRHGRHRRVDKIRVLHLGTTYRCRNFVQGLVALRHDGLLGKTVHIAIKVIAATVLLGHEVVHSACIALCAYLKTLVGKVGLKPLKPPVIVAVEVIHEVILGVLLDVFAGQIDRLIQVISKEARLLVAHCREVVLSTQRFIKDRLPFRRVGLGCREGWNIKVFLGVRIETSIRACLVEVQVAVGRFLVDVSKPRICNSRRKVCAVGRNSRILWAWRFRVIRLSHFQFLVIALRGVSRTGCCANLLR